MSKITTEISADVDDPEETLSSVSVAHTDLNLEKQTLEKRFDGGWTETAQNIMEEWLDKSLKEAKRHENKSKMYRRRHVWLSIPSFSIGNIASVLAFMNVGLAERSADVNITTAICTSLAAIFGGVISLMKYGERSERHHAAATAYRALSTHIQAQLYLPVERREIIELAYERVISRFEDIAASAPGI
jgi:hypothetical protein